jgi:small subunit ribosomal protein S6
MLGKTRTYELMLVLQPEIDSKDTAKITEIAKKLVSDVGSVKEVTIIGKKSLSYPIKKKTEGLYVQVAMEGERVDVSKIERKMQLGTEVLRYLLTYKS